MKTSRLVPAMASTASSVTTTANKPILFSVEWGPNRTIANIQSQLQPAASHFVLPDLPRVISDQDRTDFWAYTESYQRIHTIATCRYDHYKSLLDTVFSLTKHHPDSKILLVGGNDKQAHSPLSSVQAAKILHNEVGNELWGVANPNDPRSIAAVQLKIQAGMQGIITQPLLASAAKDVLHSYREISESTTILAGLAFPQTARSLQFWAKLLGQGSDLQQDPLFKSHVAFFSQPYFTPFSWIGRECQELLSYCRKWNDSPQQRSLTNDGETKRSTIDGIHCMPLQNIEDLVTIFRVLNAHHFSRNEK
jgi:5,10-methylenetetrahydrofolate reductase